ncbi:MAG: hypothetical protein CML98_07740 [Rhodobiaceae bacterium]|nr:hypothetical protein [Rhodobiaceae bacterium]|tara:strand:- start:5221 stop:5478 length:258 start_codon:yes stop_codon:yes gene_type:complete
MGKHLKTSMDEKVIDYLAIELWRVDPNNKVLHKFMSMKNEEGYHIKKTILEYDKTKEMPVHYNTDGTWKEPSGQISFNNFLAESK